MKKTVLFFLALLFQAHLMAQTNSWETSGDITIAPVNNSIKEVELNGGTLKCNVLTIDATNLDKIILKGNVLLFCNQIIIKAGSQKDVAVESKGGTFTLTVNLKEGGQLTGGQLITNSKGVEIRQVRHK